MNNDELNNNENGINPPLQEVTVETSVPEEPYPITDVDAMMNEAAAMDIAPSNTESQRVEEPVMAPTPEPAMNTTPEPATVEPVPMVEPTPMAEPTPEPMASESAPTGFEDVNKKSKVGLIIAIVVVLLLGLGGYFAYSMFLAKDPYENAISSAFKLLKSQRIDKPFKLTTTIKADSKQEGYEFLKNYSLDYSIENDTSSNASYVTFNINEKGTSLLDVVGYIKDKKAYVQSKKLTDKTYFVDDIDFSEMSNTDDIYYLMDTMENVFIAALKDEKPTKKDATVSVGGNSIKVTENVYTINKDNVNRVTKNTFNTLLSDEKAIDIIARMTDSKASDIKTALERERDEDQTAYFTTETRISIYTKGFLKTFVGFALGQGETDVLKYVVDGDNESFAFLMDDNNKLTIDATKGNADMKLVISGQTVATGKLTSKSDNDKTLVIDVPEFCTVTIETKLEENVKVSSIDTTNAVDYKNISQEDMESIEKKLTEIFEKTEAYTAIQSLYGTPDYSSEDYNVNYNNLEFDSSLEG